MATNESVVESIGTNSLRRARQLWQVGTRPGAMFYASTMVANAVGYVFFFIMARVLTVAEYGEIVTLTALVYTFGVVTRSMQAKTAQAVNALRDNYHESPGDAAALVLRQVLSPLLAGTVLIMLLGVLISGPLAAFLKLDSNWPVVMLGLYVATHFLLAGPRGLLLGAGRLRFLSWVTILDPVVRVLGALVLATSPLRSTGALLAYVAGNLVATLVALLPFVLVRPHAAAPPIQRAPVARAAVPRWLAFDHQFLFVLFVNGALMLLASADPVAMRRFFSENLAGTYAAAFLLGRIILMSTNAASWVVFSRAVKLRPHDPRTLPMLARGLALAGGIAGLVTVGYWVAPDLAIAALGGHAFRAAASFVGLVGLEMVLYAFVSVLGYYHMGIHNTRTTLPFALALVAEVVLLATFHATPYQVIFDTLIVLSALLVVLGFETVRVLRPTPGALRRVPGHKPRACMIVHSHYPWDPRVRRETEALVEDGWEVDVICVPDDGEPAEAVVNGVRVHRMPVQRDRNGSKLSYLAEYGRFLILAAVHATRLHLRRQFQVVQVHNMPDFLVFAAAGPKLLGARVVLDIHDLVPEFYALRYRLPLDHGAVRLARWVQQLSARFAHHVLTAGEPFRRQIAANGLSLERVTSIMNSPDPRLFGGAAHAGRYAGEAEDRAGRPFVLSYHGTLSEYNDLALVLRAIDRLRAELPGLEFHIYGRGRSLPALQALAAELKLERHVRFMGFRPLEDIPALIQAADLGIVPQCRSAFTALNYPTKAFEYIALGVPVVMSHSPALEELFGRVPGVLFQPDDAAGLAALIRRFAQSAELRRSVAAQQQSVCALFAWPTEKQRYVTVMNRLLHSAEPVLEAVSA